MANSMQAKKRVRQTARRTEANRARRGTIRTELRKVEEAIASGDQGAAREAFRQMQPRLMAGVNKGVVEKNTMARTLSRLSKRIKAMAA
ncbi:MAG: 30S ribosomal protein S20 [Rhodospirillaceae bacterium]